MKIIFSHPLLLNGTNWPLPDLRNSDIYSAFNKNILNFIRPSPNSIFNCHNSKALKSITRLHPSLKTEIHGHFNMTISKYHIKIKRCLWSTRWCFKMIILKRELMFLNYTLNLKGRDLNWVFEEITKSFVFSIFKRQRYI